MDRYPSILLAMALALCAGALAAQEGPGSLFHDQVAPLLKKRCGQCPPSGTVWHCGATPKRYDVCDLLVVGTGPAGLTAAIAAAEGGARVVAVGELLDGHLLVSKSIVTEVAIPIVVIPLGPRRMATAVSDGYYHKAELGQRCFVAIRRK